MAAESHLAKNTFALHLLLQHPEGLVDIVVTDKNLHLHSSSVERLPGPVLTALGPLAQGSARFHSLWRQGAVDILNPPADGTRWLLIGRNEDFGRSPFWAAPDESVRLYTIFSTSEIK
jgi:hypothetical protein